MPYAEPTAQLVVEVHVRDLKRSVEFYRSRFCVLAWDSRQLFLDEASDLPAAPGLPSANVRVMVPDVDKFWELAKSMKARIVAPLADRPYGLRDFTVADPDGFGLRFGSWIRREAGVRPGGRRGPARRSPL